MEKIINIRELGAVGDGVADDRAAMQVGLDRQRNIFIPNGRYRIKGTLRIPSHTHVAAEDDARIIHCNSFPKRRGDFLLTNSDTVNGNEDISLEGGVWDGNFDGKNNTKAPNLFDPDASSGSVLNFVNVKNLKLKNLTVDNSVVYFIRMCKLDGFEISDIRFHSDKLSFNQDGLHFGGCCRNGLVENIRSISDGETNDDMIALNADDCITRLENLDLVCGDIENIVIRNVFAENCYTIVRMLSVTSAIRNIKFENICAGCRCYAVNMDAARYCRTPLFKEEDYPGGVGCIEDVSFDDFTVWSTEPANKFPLMSIETQCRNLSIRNFRRLSEKEVSPGRELAHIRNVTATHVSYAVEGESKEFRLIDKSKCLKIGKTFSELNING